MSTWISTPLATSATSFDTQQHPGKGHGPPVGLPARHAVPRRGETGLGHSALSSPCCPPTWVTSPVLRNMQRQGRIISKVPKATPKPVVAHPRAGLQAQ